MVVVCAASCLIGGKLLASGPEYTYGQVYSGRHSSLRIVVLDQTGFRLTTLIQKILAPGTFKSPPKHLQNINPSFWASPDRGAVGFQSVFKF